MRARLLLLTLVLLVAITSTLALAGFVVGAPTDDLVQLALILLASGVGSLILGVLLVRAGAVSGSLVLRLAAGYGAGLLVVLVNVLAAAGLMFLNTHDLTLLLLVLGFGATISIAFGWNVTLTIAGELGALAQAAGRLAGGDLSVRVGARGSDEVARLATAFDHMASRLEAAFARERELEASRRELIAAVSHDLRTPLATSRAMVEALLDGVVTEPAEVQKYLELTRGEVQHLSRLIDQLFELSRIESGALQLRRSPTLLPELLAETLEAYRAHARDRGIRLEQRTMADLPPVDADPSQLQRVLRNLIDNALRYTPNGGTVEVETRRDGAAARVSVRDNGPGLAADELERIFEHFYRGERARPRGSQGSLGAGLGLAIARGLIQAHGGRIWAEPASPNGAVFFFTVPLATG